MVQRRSRVPDVDLDPAHYRFLDSIDKRRLTPVAPVSTADASTAAITAVPATAITTVATTAATSSTPYGYSQAQADAIPAAINNIIARQALIITAVNQLINAAPNALTNSVKTQFNALIEEMQKRDAMEQG